MEFTIWTWFQVKLKYRNKNAKIEMIREQNCKWVKLPEQKRETQHFISWSLLMMSDSARQSDRNNSNQSKVLIK